ncbi:MAG TPA: SH3 domain-containing protein, partial [Anaerolineales bacterium]|nr:SH3 domain-containing protein [Anaerolineales bacterium]
GMKAMIQRPLNFRSFPGLFNNLIRTNDPGTEVEIVGGPACTRYEQGGAYLWWQIKLPDGSIGWSAEASAFGAFYFMEPTQ